MNAASYTPRLEVLYGGTFDPVHLGHMAVACHARDALEARVHLMPAADPPHKQDTGADAAQRAQMLQRAVADEPGLVVDLRELRRDGPSYTVDTLRELRDQVGPEAPWALLIGGDSFRALDSWHRWQELFALAHLVVADRPGHPLHEGLSAAITGEVAGRWASSPETLRASPAGLVYALQQPLFPHSSTELRARIAAGQPWRDQVPTAVADYIQRQGLYR